MKASRPQRMVLRAGDAEVGWGQMGGAGSAVHVPGLGMGRTMRWGRGGHRVAMLVPEMAAAGGRGLVCPTCPEQPMAGTPTIFAEC